MMTQSYFEVHAAGAARLCFTIQPIKFLMSDVIIAIAVVYAKTLYCC